MANWSYHSVGFDRNRLYDRLTVSGENRRNHDRE